MMQGTLGRFLQVETAGLTAYPSRPVTNQWLIPGNKHISIILLNYVTTLKVMHGSTTTKYIVTHDTRHTAYIASQWHHQPEDLGAKAGLVEGPGTFQPESRGSQAGGDQRGKLKPRASAEARGLRGWEDAGRRSNRWSVKEAGVEGCGGDRVWSAWSGRRGRAGQRPGAADGAGACRVRWQRAAERRRGCPGLAKCPAPSCSIALAGRGAGHLRVRSDWRSAFPVSKCLLSPPPAPFAAHWSSRKARGARRHPGMLLPRAETTDKDPGARSREPGWGPKRE